MREVVYTLRLIQNIKNFETIPMEEMKHQVHFEKWVEINDESQKTYNVGDDIKF